MHIVIAMYFIWFFNEVDLVEDKGFLVPQRVDIIMAAYGDNNYELNQRRRLVWSCSVMCDVCGRMRDRYNYWVYASEHLLHDT